MKKTHILLFLAVAAVLILGTINVLDKARWQDVTDGIDWKETRDGLMAARVDQDSEAYLRAGIRKGDILSAVNKVPIKTRIDVSRALWTAAGTDQKVIYEINREGFQSYPSFYPQKQRVNPIYYYLALIGLTSMVIALIVFFSSGGRTSLPYMLFYVLCLTFAAFSIFSPTGRLDGMDMLFHWLDKIAFVAFPPCLLNFFLIFPLRKKFVSRKVTSMPVIYAPAGLLLLGRLRLETSFPDALNEAAALWFQSRLENLEMLQMIIFGLAAMAVIVDSIFRAPGILLRRQLRLILSGLVFGFLPMSIFYGLPFLTGRTPSQGMELTVLTTAFIPLTIFYAISHSKLVDIEVIIKKAATLVFSFFVIAVLYFMVSSKTRLFSENRLNVVALGLLAIILSTTLFTPLKRLFQTLFDRFVYRRSYEYRKTLLYISRELSRERNIQKLATSLLESVTNALSVRSTAVLLADENDPNNFKVLGVKGEVEGVPEATRFPDELLAEMTAREYISPYAPPEGKESRQKLEDYLRNGFCHFMPLKIEDKVVGCLFMGKKTDGSYLSREDWELLTAVSGSAALALENAYLYSRETVRAMEMQRLKDYSENIIESLTVGVAVVDDRGIVIGWNRVLEEQLGVKKDAALGGDLRHVLGAKNYGSLFPSESEPGYHLMSEINLDTPAGGRKIFDIARTPLFDNALVSYGTIMVFEDVTEKIHLQNQLVTSEKLASLGLLSAGVAHEINTPLTGISSYVQMLQKRLTDTHYAEILKKIEAQTDRVGRIIKNLLTFARSPSDASFHKVNLKELIDEIVSLIEYKLKSMNIRLELELGDTPPVYAQAERLQQVFINIILNALDAMPAGGLLHIEIEGGGDRALVRIRDSGSGIKPEHLPHIFDPFFTTKGVGKGTGLGLSISYSIIKEHQGEIEVESEPGKGTAFTIALPYDARPAEPAANSVLRT